MDTRQLLDQYNKHTQTLSNGSKLIRIDGNVYDLFIGEGWKDGRIRFRFFRPDKKIVYLRGSLSQLNELQLLEEIRV